MTAFAVAFDFCSWDKGSGTFVSMGMSREDTVVVDGYD